MASALVQFDSSSSAPVPQQALLDCQLGRAVDQIMRAVEDIVHRVPGGGAMKLDLISADARPSVQAPESEIALENARLLISMRKLRERAFGPNLFSDPTWDVLIELYLAMSEKQQVSVGNACITSGVPLTSALRLCQQLQQRGLVVRDRDPTDKRRVLLRLSIAAFDALTHVLAGTKFGHGR